jgi:hypothetical protein
LYSKTSQAKMSAWNEKDGKDYKEEVAFIIGHLSK